MAKKKNSDRRVTSGKPVPPRTVRKNFPADNKTESTTAKILLRGSRAKSVSGFPIVGIGASAGGLEALKDLLKALPTDTGMAFVIVQHLDRTHESLAPGILSRVTHMPVNEVTDGMRARPDHIYLIPPNHDMALLHDVLTLLPILTGARGQHLAIDSFFHSLALDKKEKAIGVILSGTASDGTEGLRAIKAEGGLAIAQDPDSAKYRGMPESAIASGFVDLVLSPVKIAEELARLSRHPYVAAVGGGRGLPDDEPGQDDHGKKLHEHGSSDAFRRIFVILRALTQVDFSSYKHSTLLRRIERRMVVRRSESIEAYSRSLQDNPAEVKALYADILIHVTEFFRDPDAFKVLQEQVFPKLVKNRKVNAPIRVWVPGCSTGEEAYSIAILLLDFLSRIGAKIPIQIFATDISERAIQTARAGIYPQAIESAVNKDLLKTYFERVDRGYKINKSVRDLCLFSKHDVTSDPPFSRLDLVSCRNVLIYFTVALQKRVVPLFHYALVPGGFLFLGKSEGLGELARLFSIHDKTHRIFSKVNVSTPMVLRAPVVYEPEIQPVPQKDEGRSKAAAGFQRDSERVALSRYAPPSVTVNANMEILQFQGRTAPCLESGTGQPSTNLFRMARQELLHGLRTAMLAATKKNEPSRVDGLSFEVDGSRRQFNIEVIPANPLSPPRQRNYVVFFEEVARPAAARPARPTKGGKGRQGRKDQAEKCQRIEELEKVLAASELAQRSLADDFDTTQEELTSANEELQSANEELQSTNEELETSKEELQSSNEELTTVNDELQSRNSDLVTISSDLSNILNNVEIPIVIVGSDRRIRRFTPMAEKFFNLIGSDAGRPLSDIKPNFDIDLDGMVLSAIKTLGPQESEALIGSGQWVRIQVRPYRTLDDRIDGAVITLVDITNLRERLTETQSALRYSASVADTLALPLVVLDEKLQILSANQGFARMLEGSLQQKPGSDLLSILGGIGWNTLRIRQLLSLVFSGDQELKDFEVEHEFPQLGRRIMLLNARQIKWQEPMPKALLLSIDDVTERRTLERALEHSEERFRRVVESAHDGIIIISSKGIIEFANLRTFSLFGYDPGELVGMHMEALIPERFRAGHAGSHRAYMADPQARPMGEGLELFGKRKDGSEIPIDISLSPIRTGSETRVTAIIRDISETKRLSLERKSLLEQEKEARTSADRARVDAEAGNATKDLFLATLSHELRTPLSSILSWAQLIQKNNFDPEKLKHGIQTIEQSAKIQVQLINDLLDIARIQSGKLSASFSEIDPRESVRLAVASVLFLAQRKNIVIETKVKLGSETVWADSERLQQVIWNLLTNAIKFSPEGGAVRIEVACVEDGGKKFVSIRVIDHGKGLKPEFLPKLFGRFSQADSSSIRLHGGLGLGLALVRDLTQMHGGAVRAESEGLGKGSAFTVLLPVRSEVAGKLTGAPILAEPETGRPDLAGLCVMIVEDDPSTLEALTETLASFGARTISCATVPHAMAAFPKEQVDVLVSDIAMPGEDGYGLIRKIRKLGSQGNGEVPALALTAYATPGDVERALEAGFNFHMAKPFDNVRLGHAVAKLAKRG